MLASTPYGIFQMLPVNAPQAPKAFFTKQDVSATPARPRVAALAQARICPLRALLAPGAEVARLQAEHDDSRRRLPPPT